MQKNNNNPFGSEQTSLVKQFRETLINKNKNLEANTAGSKTALEQNVFESNQVRKNFAL